MASDASTKTNPWHISDPSPWPIVASIAALVMAVGGIIFMHSGVIWGFVAGVVMMMYVFMVWFRDVISEAETPGLHTKPVQTGLRISFLLFIASEVMFFFAFFWAFYHSSLPILNLVAGPWPPEGIEVLHTWDIPFLNTLILLTSGATLTIAHHALIENDRQKFLNYTLVTVILGVIFLGFQIFEYSVATFGIADGIYPSTFYLATGFHGFHVFVGAVFLGVCYFRGRKGHFTAEHHVGFEAAAWYWHFVDVVWLFLFINVYWWGSGGWGHLPIPS